MKKYGEWCADAELEACCEWLDGDVVAYQRGRGLDTSKNNRRRIE